MIFSRIFNLKTIPHDPIEMNLLSFDKKKINTDKVSPDLRILRENYIKSVDLPKWKRKMLIRKCMIIGLVPAYFLVFTYRKIERLIDFLEYGI